MKYYILLISLIYSVNTYTQDFKENLIELDSSVGKIISLKELNHFHIFKFVDTINYEFSKLFLLKDSVFRLDIHYSNSISVDTLLNKYAIINAKEDIEYMNKYHKPKEKINEANTPKLTVKQPISKTQSNNIITNGQLYVIENNSDKKLQLKEGKFYYFKRKREDKFNYLEIKEKHRGYTYAKINKILFNAQLNETTLILKRCQGSFSELIEVKLDNILNIKENAFDSALLKSWFSHPGQFVLFNPFMILYSPPLLLYYIIFETKKFDLNDDSYFKIIKK